MGFAALHTLLRLKAEQTVLAKASGLVCLMVVAACALTETLMPVFDRFVLGVDF